MTGWAPSLPSTTTKIRLLPTIQTTNNLAIQAVISASSLSGPYPYLPYTGTPQVAPIYMYLAAAPTGWTLVAGVSDCLLGIQGGTSLYNGAGGTVVGTWTTGSYTLQTADIPSHTHVDNLTAGNYVGFSTGIGNTAITAQMGGVTQATGGGGGHVHTWGNTARPTSAVGILVSKNA